jgi:hypothetical protein
MSSATASPPSESSSSFRAPSSDQTGRAPRRGPRSPVPFWWRVLAIGLAAVLVIIGIAVVILPSTNPATLTRVEWFGYAIPGGPGVTDNGTTFTGTQFCAPSNAITVPIFSLVWTTSTGDPIQQVRLWTLLPILPQGRIVNLYLATNSSSGGTSFLSTYPDPCGLIWNLDVEADIPVVVLATITLTYNYTQPATTV